MSAVAVESRPEPSEEIANTPVTYDGATPGFFELMEIDLVAGRSFGGDAINGGPEVAVVRGHALHPTVPVQVGPCAPANVAPVRLPTPASLRRVWQVVQCGDGHSEGNLPCRAWSGSSSP